MNNYNDIFEKALLVTGSSFVPFKESDIISPEQTSTEIQQISFLEPIKQSQINCPKCREIVELSNEVSTILCKKCGYMEEAGNHPEFWLAMNPQETEKRLEELFKERIESSGGEIIGAFSNNYICKIDGKLLVFFVETGTKNLSDYYKLKGYAQANNAEHGIMISHSFESELVNLAIKSKSVSLFGFKEFFENFAGLLKKSDSDLKIFQSTKQIIEESRLKFQEDENLSKIKKDLEHILGNIEKWALQNSVESSSKQGLLFQEAIVSLLNFTVFQAKLIAGKNAEDGIIYLQSEGETLWFPFEIKSFEPKKQKLVYNLKKAYGQIEKYSSALKHSAIKDKVKCPSFLIIAYDFDESNEDNNKILDELERKYGMKYVLFPLKSILRLVNLHIERTRKDAMIPVKEVIENLFEKNRYISEKNVEDFYDELDTLKENFTGEIEILRKLIEKRA